MIRTSKAIHKDMFKVKQEFTGVFEDNCQEQSVPQSLVSLIDTILTGTDIEQQLSETDDPRHVAAVTISQLIVFNAIEYNNSKHQSANNQNDTKSVKIRHKPVRTTPLPIYTAIKVHNVTRSKELVNSLNTLGLCISYESLSTLSTDLGNAVVKMFESENVALSPHLRFGVPSFGQVDNIDVDPKNRDAMGCLHGTCITLTQLPSKSIPGVERDCQKYRELVHQDCKSSNSKKVQELPSFYTDIQLCKVSSHDVSVPKSEIVADDFIFKPSLTPAVDNHDND